MLGSEREEHDEEWVDAWLELQVDGRANLYYWNKDVKLNAAVLARAQPVVEARGSPDRKAGFYIQLASQRARAARFRVDDETLMCARMAVQFSEQGVGEHRVAYCHTNLGGLLFWHGDVDRAEQHIERALALGERVGDPKCRRWCLSHLMLIAVRRKDVEAVRCLSRRTLAVESGGEDAALTGAGKAGLAWVAWKEGHSQEVVRLVADALELWSTPTSTFYYKGLCLWPFISINLAVGRPGEAVDAGRQLLEPTQVRLPDDLEALVKAAEAAWGRHEAATATAKLSQALGRACQLGFA